MAAVDADRNAQICAGSDASGRLWDVAIGVVGRIDHVEWLGARLRERMEQVLVLKDSMGTKQRAQLAGEFAAMENSPRVILATGSYIGEGSLTPGSIQCFSRCQSLGLGRCFDGAFLAGPQQPCDSLTDLVNQRQILVPLGVLNIIHADGAHRFKLAMVQPKVDHVFNGVANLFLRCAERLGGFLPGQFPGLARQKQYVSFGQVMFAIAPGGTVSTTTPQLRHRRLRVLVQQEDQKTPERNELEPSHGKMIVTRCRFAAARADRRRVLLRSNQDFDTLFVG